MNYYSGIEFFYVKLSLVTDGNNDALIWVRLMFIWVRLMLTYNQGENPPLFFGRVILDSLNEWDFF